MTLPRLLGLFSLLVIAPTPLLAQRAPADETALLDFFEKKVRPVLVANCYNCHSANTNSRGGLRVDDRNGLLNGGSKGPAIIPGQPEKSLLMQAVRQTHATIKMPPKKQIAEHEVADLAQWIKDGAAWPKPVVPASIGAPSAKYDRLRKEHWAWQPLNEIRVPQVKDAAWPTSDVDRFVLAGLEAKNLRPVADAEKLTLLRRVTFDLTGLPPTPPEMDDFAADTAKDAFAKVVDRLLAKPAFGERWGRHWLDIARYGESTGSARNLPYPHAWRYRDYVIDALNSDMPYDQFLREQIAGDLLPATDQTERDRQLIATGFLALGVRDVNQRFKVRFTMDNIDEQIDTVTRSVLALTVSCARCHNHKFDPIPTTDYYAIAGIFHSTDLCAGLRNKMGGGGLDYYDTSLLLPLGGGKKNDAKLNARIAQTKNALAKAQAHLLNLSENLDKNPPGPEREKKLLDARKEVKKVQAEMIALSDPAMRGGVALGARDAKTVGDTEIRIRGEAEALGPTVPRGFLTLFDLADAPRINPGQSGRLELAQWLTHPGNPLTPRVMANRVWKHLFGQGLVLSVDNFGVTGDVPSNPELLDHLARQLRQEGWSIKKLVRSLVLSRAYQLASEATPAHLAADPANRLVWRHSPRRLDAEEIRDAMLAAAGTLDLARPQGSPAQELKVIEIRNDGAEAKRLEAQALASTQRSVYLPLVRGITPRALEVFDFAEQGMVTGSRDTTTVATQALYLLNDPFVVTQAKGLAKRVLALTDLDEDTRIARAYRLSVHRPATPQEIQRARQYIDDYAAALRGDNAAEPRLAAWTSFTQAILAAAEFRYIR